ncbi:MAG TPA: porin, partial [Methylococcaceae bacterium]|nr:porin [Methylococcaceae bacterium]
MRLRTHSIFRTAALSSALIFALNPLGAQAENIEDTTGLVDYALGSKNHQPLSDYGVTWGGWTDFGVTANANAPADKFNGPVTFGDRSGELQMNQFYGYLQRAITVGSDDFDIGGRVDVMYGTDAIFTQAYGAPALNPRGGYAENRGNYDLHLTSWSQRFYGLALPQAYVEMNLPVGNGLAIKAGHFYTPVGYEVVTAPDNFFYTHAYTMQYGEPF